MIKVRNKKVILISFVFILFILNSCKKTSTGVENYNKKAAYVSSYVSDFDIRGNVDNLYVFYDKDGNYLEHYKFNALTGHGLATNDFIYYYGKKGIVKLDRTKKTIEKISDAPTDNIDIDNNKLYYTENNGYLNYPHPKYDAKICQFQGDCLEFENHLSFKILDGKAYVKLNQYDKDTLESYYVLRVYDLKNKKILEESKIGNNEKLFKIKNKIFILREDKKLYNYHTKEEVFDFNIYPDLLVDDIYVDYKDEVIAVISNLLVLTNNKERKTILYNITKNKEELNLDENAFIYHSTYSKNTIKNKMRADYFENIFTNEKIQYKKLGDKYTFSETFALD